MKNNMKKYRYIYVLFLIILLIGIVLYKEFMPVEITSVNSLSIDILAKQVINRALMYPERDELITLLLKLNSDFLIEFNSIYKPTDWDIFYNNIYTLISIYINSYKLTLNFTYNETVTNYFISLLGERDQIYYEQVNELITKTLSNLFVDRNIPTELLNFLQQNSSNEKYKPLWDYLAK